MQIDHRDHDGLNNQKSNLRVCTRSENNRNRKSYKNSLSIYKGVYWSKPRKKWLSQIRLNNKLKYIGLFTSETEAAIAYNTAAIKYFGEFACLNEIN